MPEADLALLIRAAARAAEIAKGFLGGDLDVRRKAHDQGPVTAADLAVNAALEEDLRGARPGYGWLSEESTDDPARLEARTVFVVDPIDGTRAFIEGQKSWSHALAVVEEGRVTAAVVHVPLLDKVYTATTGGGARLNGKPIGIAALAPDLDEANVLANKQNMEPRFWRGGVPGFARHHRPSLAYRQCLVAENRFDAMLTFRPAWEWDIAAGSLILEEAGARITDRHGARLRFNGAVPQASGVIAAGPALHAEILDRAL